MSSLIILLTANCGIPASPQDGYIHSYVSTLEDSEVIITCREENETITCDHGGNWMPNPTDICMNDFQTGNKLCIIAGTATGTIICVIVTVAILIIVTLLLWRLYRSKATARGSVRWHRSHTGEDTVALSPSLDEI